MGVRENGAMDPDISMRCPGAMCSHSLVTCYLEHEDEEILQYVGSCMECKREYNIVTNKDPEETE